MGRASASVRALRARVRSWCGDRNTPSGRLGTKAEKARLKAASIRIRRLPERVVGCYWGSRRAPRAEREFAVRMLLVSALVLVVLSPAVARETVCDRHTEGGRVLQICQFVDTPVMPPAAQKDGDASEAPAPPATAQAPPQPPPRPAPPPRQAQRMPPPPSYAPPPLQRPPQPYPTLPACLAPSGFCGPPAAAPGYLARQMANPDFWGQ